MSKKLLLLLILGWSSGSIYAQTTSPKQQWKMLNFILPSANLQPQELRDLVSEVDYAPVAEYKGLKIRRTGRFRDCLCIENGAIAGASVEVKESVLLYFIQYQEWRQNAQNKAKASQSDTYQASLVSY
ncbi:MAG: hypothetical protein MUE85_13755 [Microscillaceae bacterium]|jgi:hypothetical protein|nr:hypothetical protein [Microscillaceae bacterium]